MEITKEEAQQLYDCLKREYISYEFYPLVHNIMTKLKEYLEEAA